MLKFTLIAIAVVAITYSVLLLPMIIDDVEAILLPPISFDAIQIEFMNNYEDVLSQHDPNLPADQQQAYLDHLQFLTDGLSTLVPSTIDLEQRRSSLLPQGQAILDAGIIPILEPKIPPQPIVVDEDDGRVLLELREAPHTVDFSFSLKDWNCSLTDTVRQSVTCILK